ncbi:MAG: hypothetical protein M9887_01670 [Chitinophagales bacterium]|nr:hypothetical protein [Chitinophagales bacterium]
MQESTTSLKIKKKLWIHCASAGEFEQCIPLLLKIKSTLDIEIVISFFSFSGMQYYQLNPIVNTAFFLPIDTPKNAKALISNIQPDYVLWVKYEFWPNVLNEIFTREIPCDLLFADLKNIEKKNFIEKRIIIPLLKRFSHIYSISDSSKLNINYQKVNDGKWEKALDNTKLSYNDKVIEQFIDGNTAIVLGSAHLSDLAYLKTLLNDTDIYNDLKFIVVPHEVNEIEIKKIKKELPQSGLYSQNETHQNILIMDQLGQLKFIYRYAQVAWIGGGFDKSVHNVLEAAAYNIPLISGVKIQKMHEAEVLKKEGILKTFSNIEELKACLKTSFNDETISNLSQKVFSKYTIDNYISSIIKDIKAVTG